MMAGMAELIPIAGTEHAVTQELSRTSDFTGEYQKICTNKKFEKSRIRACILGFTLQ